MHITCFKPVFNVRSLSLLELNVLKYYWHHLVTMLPRDVTTVHDQVCVCPRVCVCMHVYTCEYKFPGICRNLILYVNDCYSINFSQQASVLVNVLVQRGNYLRTSVKVES